MAVTRACLLKRLNVVGWTGPGNVGRGSIWRGTREPLWPLRRSRKGRSIADLAGHDAICPEHAGGAAPCWFHGHAPRR